MRCRLEHELLYLLPHSHILFVFERVLLTPGLLVPLPMLRGLHVPIVLRASIPEMVPGCHTARAS